MTRREQLNKQISEITSMIESDVRRMQELIQCAVWYRVIHRAVTIQQRSMVVQQLQRELSELEDK
jgi:hypothetical protein